MVFGSLALVATAIGWVTPMLRPLHRHIAVEMAVNGNPNDPYDPWFGRSPPYAHPSSGVGSPPEEGYTKRDYIGSKTAFERRNGIVRGRVMPIAGTVLSDQYTTRPVAAPMAPAAAVQVALAPPVQVPAPAKVPAPAPKLAPTPAPASAAVAAEPVVPEDVPTPTQSVPEASSSSAVPPTPEFNLVGKVKLIKELLGLDSTLNIASAIKTAQQEVGLEAKGNLNDQANELLLELTPI
eukprot:CAMPEP_0174718366 /NCGR_PEP_ID=MMETSP1094-20130205/28721_1 /TAXON_ID=156173 /ORGANISM="Chrysochromulina brevifilum, Strain UTEX LB 985" /LENGTH=236 /DNA_ID=CAMNT_0015918451 /DNA_START=19 /DNA_END=729 /DNA_ORIENTATION=+